VRDEAARARKAKRLVPILLDRARIPKVFGSINAEDFTAWNGAAGAPQVDVLYEMLKARLEGRAPDGGVLARWRRAKARGKLVSVGVVALATLIVAYGVVIWINGYAPAQTTATAPRSDFAHLMELVSEGKISGEQAVELSKFLQQQAFDNVPAPRSVTAPAPGAVSAAELEESARATFADAAAQLLQDPNPVVREATLEAARPRTRQAGIDKLWDIAKKDSPSSGAIYRYCAAIGALAQDSRTQTALERARDSNPQDRRLWRLLSVQYARNNDAKGAQGAALVGEGLSAAALGQPDQAAEALEKALPLLAAPGSKAFVLGQLGDAAAKRDDWSAAEKRYRAAVDLHAQEKNIAGVAIDAPKLARAQFQQGEQGKACATLNAARRLGVETVAGQMSQMCGKDAAPSTLP
jgi:tetratricopeptide (TPR) repeat protein